MNSLLINHFASPVVDTRTKRSEDEGFVLERSNPSVEVDPSEIVFDWSTLFGVDRFAVACNGE